MKLHIWVRVLALAFMATIVTPAFGQANLVVNPGFDTGGFAGWASEAGTAIVQNGRSGSFAGNLGATSPAVSGFEQNIATQIGQNYTFSFYVRGDSIGTNGVQALFGSNEVYAATNLNTLFTLQSFNVTATSATTKIRFAGYDNNNYIAIDDVALRVVAAPEPATWGLMIFGFGLIGAALRRRRSSAMQAPRTNIPAA